MDGENKSATAEAALDAMARACESALRVLSARSTRWIVLFVLIGSRMAVAAFDLAQLPPAAAENYDAARLRT